MLQAATELRDRIFHTAALMLKAASRDCLFRGNRVVLASDESRSVTLQQVAQVANVGGTASRTHPELPSKLATG